MVEPPGTPTYDSGQIFFLDRWGLAFCLNATNGTVIWERNVQEDAGARIPDWGFGGPLVLQPGFLNVGEAGLALNRATGTSFGRAVRRVPATPASCRCRERRRSRDSSAPVRPILR